MKKTTRKIIAVIIAFSIIFMTGCSNNSNNMETSGEDLQVTAIEGTLTVGINAEATHLDGTRQGVDPNIKIHTQIYDKLVLQDPETGEIIPSLAESWEMIDDTTWQFNIRQGVIFHNGETLTAEDCLFSIQQNNTSTGYQWMWGAIDTDGSYCQDDYTLIVKTYDIYPALLSMLSSECSIVCKSAYEEMGADEYGRNPIGTGPYKFAEWIAGDSVTLERNDNYWGDKPYFEKLTFRFITDDTTRSLSLETGEIDIAMDLPSSQIEHLKEKENIDIVLYPSLSVDYIGFNCQKAPYNDVRVRKALRYAIDLDSMVNLAYGITGEVADGICSPSFCNYVEAKDDLVYTQDIEKAKELLAEAGYPDGFSCQLMVTSKQCRVDMVEMLQNEWAKIGVTIKPYVTEIGNYYEIVDSGEYDMFYGGWLLLANDGDLMHDTFYSTESLWYGTNYTAYVNPEFDALVDAARVEVDPGKRSKLYGEVQNLIRSELPFIPCAWNNKASGMRNTLTGYIKDPSGHPNLATIVPKQ